MSTLTAGFFLMGIGLAVVFAALILFYGSIRLLTALFREKDKPEEPADPK